MYVFMPALKLLETYTQNKQMEWLGSEGWDWVDRRPGFGVRPFSVSHFEMGELNVFTSSVNLSKKQNCK